MYIHGMLFKTMLLPLLLGSIAATAHAQYPATPIPGGPTTKILAMGHITMGTDVTLLPPILKQEVPATLQLYLDGKLDQWYYRNDGQGVVFILNCKTVEEAHALLEKLPLGQHHYMEFDLIPLGPLVPLKMLLGDKAASAAK